MLMRCRCPPENEQLAHFRVYVAARGLTVQQQGLGERFGNREARVEAGIRVLKDELHFASKGTHSATGKPCNGLAAQLGAARSDWIQADQGPG
jgi:hypothetical protein